MSSGPRIAPKGRRFRLHPSKKQLRILYEDLMMIISIDRTILTELAYIADVQQPDPNPPDPTNVKNNPLGMIRGYLEGVYMRIGGSPSNLVPSADDFESIRKRIMISDVEALSKIRAIATSNSPADAGIPADDPGNLLNWLLAYNRAIYVKMYNKVNFQTPIQYNDRVPKSQHEDDKIVVLMEAIAAQL
jgi:hypothetical protein